MIYSYKCLTCGKTFEKDINLDIERKVSELGYDPSPRCILCHSSSTKKIITPIPVIFKGKGFTKSVKEKA